MANRMGHVEWRGRVVYAGHEDSICVHGLTASYRASHPSSTHDAQSGQHVATARNQASPPVSGLDSSPPLTSAPDNAPRGTSPAREVMASSMAL